MKRRIFITSVNLLCAFTLLSPATAQQSDPQLIYEGVAIERVFWSSNSQDLLFRTLKPDGLSTMEQAWATLDVATSQLNLSDTVPVSLPDQLSLDIQAQTILQTSRAVFPSPDGRFLVASGSVEAATLSTHTIITDLQTDAQTSILLRGVGAGHDSDRYNVQWSADSQVFVLSASGISSGPYYFHHVDFSGGLAAPVVNDIFSLDFQGVTYTTREVYDVSFDGDHVLLQVVYRNPSNISALLIWDAQGEHRVIDLNALSIADVLTGSFASDSEDILELVTEDGLVRVDLAAFPIQATVLNPEINTERYIDAKFSPDGQRLALVAPMPGNQTDIYMLDLTQ